jgi:DNA invertase Pin-like site-specific DNA recombinase
MRYVLYARKSSESEDRQVQSIEDQLRILREFADVRGLTITEEITESKSAKGPGERPAFARMLARIEKGAADAILCWSINRLTRNPIDSGRVSWLLQQGTLRAIQTPDKTYLPEDNVLLFAVETGTANQFILDLKKAVVAGMESKAQKGEFPHRAPEGYRNNPYTRCVEPDPERFALLERAWRLLIAGTHTPPRSFAFSTTSGATAPEGHPSTLRVHFRALRATRSFGTRSMPVTSATAGSSTPAITSPWSRSTSGARCRSAASAGKLRAAARASMTSRTPA